MKKLKLSAEWLDDAENAALEERATVADVRMTVASRNVMQHFFAESLSDHVTVSLYGLVNGLTHDWWSIFGARDREFSLMNYRGGYLLPDVAFWFDGSVFEVEARQRAYQNPDVRFWGGMKEVLSRSEAEAALSEIIEMVLDRLKAAKLDQTSAALRWKRVQSSRMSNDQEFCEVAGSLGLDPYDIADEAASFIEKAEQIFEREPLLEFAAGATGVKQGPLLEWVERMLGYRGFQYRLADLKGLAAQTVSAAPTKTGQPAWATGYRRARVMRETLGLSQSDRFQSFKELARLLGASKSYNTARQVDGIRALRSEREDGVQIHLRNHGESGEAPAAHLFAFTRAVGDVMCFPDSHLAPINDAHHAYRQAAGRAFAAEFLAPVDEVRSMVADKHDIVSIANEFAVSTAVIERQVENQVRIEDACA